MGEPNMQTATDSSAFQQAIEGLERLSGDDQILLVEIIRQRLIQHRRSESVTQVAEAGEAYQTGSMQRSASENLTQALDGLKAAGGQAIRQVVISRGEDGYWVAECPTLPGCISQGSSREETVANIREAIRGYITALQEDALPVPGEHFDTLVLAV